MYAMPGRPCALAAGAATALLALAVFPALASSQDPELQEWAVPWEGTRPRDPYVGPGGKVWFVGQIGHYVASLDPATGDFRKYELEAGVGPHNVVVDETGTVWFSGNLLGYIGKLDPETGRIQKLPMPREEARDPHTLVFDGRGHIWFTVQSGNFIGRLTMATGEVRLVEAPQALNPRGELTSSRPYGIKIDAGGHSWVVLFNTNKIARVDRETFQVTEFLLPEGARPRRLEIAEDQGVWYVDYARGKLARLDPGNGAVQEWGTPGGDLSRPYGMALDHRNRVWFVETGSQPNRFVGFDIEAKEFFSVAEIGSGGGTVRHMAFHEETRTVWFGTDTNTIGRARIPED